MELDHALSQIADIRLQMSRTCQFRGFRAATTLFTAVAAVVAGVWQSIQIPDTSANPQRFLLLWISVAAFCLALNAVEIFRRYRQTDSFLQRELTLQTVEQFAPAVVAGGIVTLVLWRNAPGSLWLLPGLWQIFYGLALFGLRRLCSPSLTFVGTFFVLCGTANLCGVFASFSPWGMVIPFGLGQFANATILYLTLEFRHVA